MTEAVKPQPTNPRWDDIVNPGGEDWLSDHSKQFNDGVIDLKEKLAKAFDDVKGDPTNPTALAEYQTKLSAYTTYRSLQSNSAKSLADMQKQTARNLG